MADYNLVGRIRPVYKGVWNSATDYTVLDIVVSADKHSTYIANKDVPAGVSLTNAEYWGVMTDVSDMIVPDDALQAKANALKAHDSGNPVQIHADGGSTLKLVTEFVPIQSGSGDPYPAGGKGNICPGFENGIAYNNSNGSDLANAAYGRTLKIPVKDGVTYVQSNSQGLAVSNVHFWDAEGNWLTQIKTNDINTRPDGVDVAFIGLVYYRSAGVNLEWVQVEVGTTATEYKPYSNIRPITGRTSAELVRCGRNLLKNTGTSASKVGVTFTVNADGTITANGTATATALFMVGYMPVRAGATYICDSSATDIGCSLRLNSGSTVVHDFATDTQFTADADAECEFMLRVASGDTVDTTIYPMIRLASDSDATFEPYQGKTYAHDFGRIVYGGTLDWNTGVLTVDAAIRNLDGNENIVHAASGVGRFVCYQMSGAIAKWSDDSGVAPLVCSHYAACSADALYTTDTGYLIAQTGEEVWFSNNDFTDVDTFRAYLAAQYEAGTPVQIAYKLAEPITVQLTPQQITALAGVNTVYTDGDELSVDYNKSLRRAFDEVVARLAALEAVATNT